MKLFDAHCHLQDEALFPDIGKILERAAAAGVEGMAVCGTNSNDWKKVIELAEKFPTIGKCRCDVPVAFPMIGIHPWFVGGRGGSPSRPGEAARPAVGPHLESFQALEKMVRDFPMLGIGETGLDFREKFTNRAEQENCFRAHLELATELDRPVAIHCVQAWGRMLEIFHDYPKSKKILHAYGGAPELIPGLMDLNCWFSFGEAVMNPKFKRVREAAVAVPAERLLIETDSDGEPEKLLPVVRAVAELRGVSVEEIAARTFNNARTLFGLKT